MLRLERTVAVLLCGGRSLRFGEADKLLHPLSGKPLVAHAAEMLASLPFAARIATVRSDALELQALLQGLGYQLAPIAADADQQASLQAGMEAALAGTPEVISLALGDMPFVPRDHFTALADAASASRPAISRNESWFSPPWIAPADWVLAHRDALKAALQRDARPVDAPASVLRDIDTPADLPPT